jgi:hypothetical protein
MITMPDPTFLKKLKEPKSAKFSRIVRIGTVGEAEESIKQMKEQFKGAESRAKQIHVVKSLNAASNVAKIISKNPHVSSPVQEEKKKISKLYRDATTELSSQVEMK